MNEPKVLWSGTSKDFLQEPHESHARVPAHGRAMPAEIGVETEEVEVKKFLGGLPLLRDDLMFVEHQVRFLHPDLKNKALNLYRQAFMKAMAACKVEIKKENAGRRRANQTLRRWVARTVTRHGR